MQWWPALQATYGGKAVLDLALPAASIQITLAVCVVCRSGARLVSAALQTPQSTLAALTWLVG